MSLRFLSSRSQKPQATEPFRRWDFPNGAPWATFYRTPFGFLMRFADLADFEVSLDGENVTCASVPGVSNDAVEQIYLNQVLPFVLNRLGKLVFHASSIDTPKGAIAFVGESGRGKSTIAAGFAIAGFPFLGDDGMVLEPRNKDYMVLPSHSSIRLWQDSCENLLPQDAVKAPTLPRTAKMRILAGAKLMHCEQPRALRVAYFLSDANVGKIKFRRFRPAEALIWWTKHLFILDLEDRALVSAHFNRIATLAGFIPCYNVDYPRRYDEIAEFVTAIITHATRMDSSA